MADKFYVDLGAEAEAARLAAAKLSVDQFWDRKPGTEKSFHVVAGGKTYFHGFFYDVSDQTAAELTAAIEQYRG